MASTAGMIYAVIICAIGGFIGQYAFNFFRPKIGIIFGGGVAMLIAFFAMVMIAGLTQIAFNYPPIN